MRSTSNAKERLMAATTSLLWEDSYGAVTIDDSRMESGDQQAMPLRIPTRKTELATA